MSLPRSVAGGLLLALVLLGGAQAGRSPRGLRGCRPKDYRDNLDKAVETAKKQCQSSIQDMRPDVMWVVRKACIASRLKITHEQEDLKTFVEGLTNDTEFINLFVKSSATCLNNLPDKLTDIQKKYFVFDCLEHQVRLDCIFGNKESTQCEQVLQLTDLRDCSVSVPMDPLDLDSCMYQILSEKSGGHFSGGYDRGYRPFQWWNSASCGDRLVVSQSFVACAMKKGGLTTNGTVNRDALEKAIEMRKNSDELEAIAEKCPQPKDSDLIACWTTNMRDMCIAEEAATGARLVPQDFKPKIGHDDDDDDDDDGAGGAGAGRQSVV